MFRKALAFSVLSGLFLAAPAYADGFGRRGAGPGHRIEDGWRGGELTRYERHVLREEQRRIERLERHFWRDGRLSWFEARELRRAHEQARRHIYQLKHNARDRHF